MKNEDVSTTTIWRIAEFSDVLCMLSPAELTMKALHSVFIYSFYSGFNVIYFNNAI